jgi:hypothetical protein
MQQLHRLSSSCGRLKGKLRILTLSPEKERIQDLAAKRRQVGLQIPNLVRKSKRELQNCLKSLRHV